MSCVAICELPAAESRCFSIGIVCRCHMKPHVVPLILLPETLFFPPFFCEFFSLVLVRLDFRNFYIGYFHTCI